MKVIMTGATGFTGSHILPLLLKQNWDVSCLVRETSDLSKIPRDQVAIRIGDVKRKSSLLEAFQGQDILINVTSLGFGHAANIVQSAVQSGIKRAVFFSTTSIYTTLNPESKQIRLTAEKRIRESGLEYTIIRPTMIYGSSRDRNICKFVKFIQMSPVFPVFGSGEFLIQPVFVKDLARAVIQILDTQVTIGQAYNLSGKTALSLKEIVDEISGQLEKKIYLLNLPPAPFILGLKTIEKLFIPFPISSEQIQRFNEDKAFSHQKAEEDFGYDPISFSEGLSYELEDMEIKKFHD